MIFGKTSQSRTAWDDLDEAPFTVYLGGSRRMAERYDDEVGTDKYYRAEAGFVIEVGDDTDYDFYATYTPEVEEYLLSKGFEFSEANNYYLDTECVSIMKKGNTQIVLRRDAEFYKTVFENIDLEVYYHYLWKSSPTQPNRALIGPFFNMLFKIAHATKGV